MIKNALFFIFLFNFLFIQGLSPNFHTAMGKNHPVLGSSYKKGISNSNDQKELQHFCQVYKKNNLSKIKPQQSPKIPKIIHQIWLGSPVPEKFTAYINSWKQAHPNWEYRLWTDTDIEAFNLENKKLYHAAVNYAERSDIARYEILYQQGGIFIDIDMECIKPIDILHHTYDFFASLEPMAEAPFLKKMVIVSNAIIAACPNHPIIGYCVDRLKMNSHHNDIILRTGPIFFTNVLLDSIESKEFTNIVLPASYFFPFGKNVKSKKLMEQCIKPETFGIHHWAGSWMFNPSAFIPGYTFKIKIVQK